MAKQNAHTAEQPAKISLRVTAATPVCAGTWKSGGNVMTYTFHRFEGMRPVDCIEGLSKDAAMEIARATSFVGDLCTVTTPHCIDSFGTKHLKCWQFRNGQLQAHFICGAEDD